MFVKFLAGAGGVNNACSSSSSKAAAKQFYAYDLVSVMLIEMDQRTPKDPSALCQRVADPHLVASQVDLEDKDGLTPLMHGLLAVRSSMDSESAVRAVSVLAQHSKPGSLQRQEDGVLGAQTMLVL